MVILNLLRLRLAGMKNKNMKATPAELYLPEYGKTTGKFTMDSRRACLKLATFISLVTLVVYLPALWNGFVLWDDDSYLLDNSNIRSLGREFFRWAFTSFHERTWHPLAWVSHALDYAVWGLNPIGHHLTSILLHCVNTFIVVVLVGRLFEHTISCSNEVIPAPFFSRRDVLTVAGVVGILFGLHPLHVESVAWVSDRKDLLCALFFMLSIYSYSAYANSTVSNAIGEQKALPFRNKYYLSALGFFSLSLLSKSMAVTLPVVLLILDWYPFSRLKSTRSMYLPVMEKLPFMLLSLATSGIALLANSSTKVNFDIEPLTTRLAVAAQSLVIYIWKIIVPLNLMPVYLYPQKVSPLSPEYLAMIAIVAISLILCCIMVRNQRLWLALWGYYVVTMLPVIGVIQISSHSMADRYSYLPGIAPALVLGVAAARLRTKTDSLLKNRHLTTVLALVLVMLMASLTLKQISIWKSSITLWSYAIDKGPGRIYLAYHNRGVALVAAGEFDRALNDATQAIALKPDYVEAYHNRGLAFAGKGEYDLALADYSTAIYLEPGNAAFFHSRGAAFAGKGDFARAVADYSHAIALKPDNADFYHSRGAAFAGSGQFDRAIYDYTLALTLKPEYVNVYINRGLVFAGKGEFDSAIKDYEAAIHLKPEPELASSAYSNLGIAFANKGELDRALADFTTAISLKPGSITGYVNRGAVFKMLGQFDRAEADYGRVLSLQPGFVDAYLERGKLYQQMGKKELAMNDYQRACLLGSAVGCRKVGRSVK